MGDQSACWIIQIDYLVIYVESSAETLERESFGQTLVTHRFKNANLANYVNQETSRSTQGARQ